MLRLMETWARDKEREGSILRDFYDMVHGDDSPTPPTTGSSTLLLTKISIYFICLISLAYSACCPRGLELFNQFVQNRSRPSRFVLGSFSVALSGSGPSSLAHLVSRNHHRAPHVVP